MINSITYLSVIISGLFSALDIHSNLGVISYGVSMTTLEDVFLKLEVEAEIDQAGKNKKLIKHYYRQCETVNGRNVISR